MRKRRFVLTFAAMLAVTPLLDAQYVRIGNAGVLPNGAMAAPTVLKSTIAAYSEDARSHGIEGTVTIEASMSEDGQVKSMRVLKGLGFGLDELALTSVQQWTFSPATRLGVPVSVIAQVDVPFILASANAV